MIHWTKTLKSGVFAVHFVRIYDADHSVLSAGWAVFCVYGIIGTDYHPTMLCITIKNLITRHILNPIAFFYIEGGDTNG